MYNSIAFHFIFAESRQQGRFAGFSIYISKSTERENSDLCYKDGPNLPPLNFTTICNTTGRYVIFYNERCNGVIYPTGYENSTNVFMELCEVTIYGKTKIRKQKCQCYFAFKSSFIKKNHEWIRFSVKLNIIISLKEARAGRPCASVLRTFLFVQ